jgi:hypothetical protein
MKKGLLAKIAKDFEQEFPSDWERAKNKFQRQSGQWVQEIGFNASRFADEYNPVSTLFYLSVPVEPPPSLSVQLLLNKKHPVQRWITINDHEKDVTEIFQSMDEQFQPKITEPLREDVIIDLLQKKLDYWPHPYVLCIWASEHGKKAGAAKYFKSFEAAVQGKNYSWVNERRNELQKISENSD